MAKVLSTLTCARQVNLDVIKTGSHQQSIDRVVIGKCNTAIILALLEGSKDIWPIILATSKAFHNAGKTPHNRWDQPCSSQCNERGRVHDDTCQTLETSLLYR